MEYQGEQHVAHLEGRVRELGRQLETMSDSSDLEEMIILMHRPGWTTLAEYLLVGAALDAIQQQVELLTGMRQALLNGSRAIAQADELNPQPLPPGEAAE